MVAVHVSRCGAEQTRPGLSTVPVGLCCVADIGVVNRLDWSVSGNVPLN